MYHAMSDDFFPFVVETFVYSKTSPSLMLITSLVCYSLSSDLQRAIGHAMCIDSPTIEDCREALSRDPIIRSLVGVDDNGQCDVSSVPLYRWR